MVERITERVVAAPPWWRDLVRLWVPVLGFGGMLMFQLVGLQREIDGLRADFRQALHQEIGGLRDELRQEFREEIGSLREEVREEIGGLRGEIRKEFGTLREEIRTIRGEGADLGERITRLEAVFKADRKARRDAQEPAAPESRDPDAPRDEAGPERSRADARGATLGAGGPAN